MRSGLPFTILTFVQNGDCLDMPNGEQKKGLRFSPEVNAGHLLTILSIFIGIVGGYAAFYSRLSILEYKQLQTDQVVSELKNGTIQTGVAIQELKTGNMRLMILMEQLQKHP